MSRLPLLLGEAPSERGDRYHAFPLSGAPAEFICKLMEWETEGPAYWTLIEHFETLNAIERYRDAYPWSKPRAQERWTRWLLTRPEEEQRLPLIVVCLGQRAAGAVGLRDDKPYGEWLEAGLLQAVCVPHPSGRNRFWNTSGARESMRSWLEEAIARAEAARWKGTVA
ncbi:MAG TPA: uracil-DNA glycosylase family protein [Longimicrobiales bacterium]